MVATSCKYLIFAIDTWREGRWDEKGTYVFYLELVTDLLHLFVYFCFFIIIFAYYGLPIHLVRDLYMTFRNFNRRVKAFIQYRRVTANLNERFPDATTEELEALDDSCIICRDDMSVDAAGGARPKKLPCGHIFHLRCLRTWMERQQACPTCRAPVEPEDLNAEPTRRDAREREIQAQLMNELFGPGQGRANAADPNDPPRGGARGGAEPQGGAGAAGGVARRQEAIAAVQRATAEALEAARRGTPPPAAQAPAEAVAQAQARRLRFRLRPMLRFRRRRRLRHRRMRRRRRRQPRRRRRSRRRRLSSAPQPPPPRPPGYPTSPYQWPSPGASPYYFPPPLTPPASGTDSVAGVVGSLPRRDRRSPRLRRTRSRPPQPPPSPPHPRRRSSRSFGVPRWVCWRRRLTSRVRWPASGSPPPPRTGPAAQPAAAAGFGSRRRVRRRRRLFR